MDLQIWTDGSCNNNPKHANFGLGGWGFCVVKDDKIIFEDLGYDEKVTSQKMEMQAVLEAMKYIKKKYLGKKIDICSDSAYVVNCFNDKWYERWIDIDFLGVKNEEYWKKLLELYQTKLLKVRFVKVKGHAGIKYNERADYLAGEARQFIINKKLG